MSIGTSKCGVYSGGGINGFHGQYHPGEWPPNSGHFKRPKKPKKLKPKKKAKS